MTALKCPICGAPVPPSRVGRPRKFCSTKCAWKAAQSALRRRRNEYARENAPTKLAAKSLKQMQLDRTDEMLKVAARLRARDADYAASPCAARVTVDCVRTTDGRTLVVETRGQRCIGWRSSGHVSHS